MTHYLRNLDNRSVVDVETQEDDLRALVVIGPYSDLLLETSIRLRPALIHDFEGIQELRGRYQSSRNLGLSPDQFVCSVLFPAAERWNLRYVSD